MDRNNDEASWPQMVGEMLEELCQVGEDLATSLRANRARIIAGADAIGTELSRENAGNSVQALLERLRQCHERRRELIQYANGHGAHGNTLQALIDALPDSDIKRECQQRWLEAAEMLRSLQYEVITNWVVLQRANQHAVQLRNVLATGRTERPTYAPDDADGPRGGFLDRAA